MARTRRRSVTHEEPLAGIHTCIKEVSVGFALKWRATASWRANRTKIMYLTRGGIDLKKVSGRVARITVQATLLANGIEPIIICIECQRIVYPRRLFPHRPEVSAVIYLPAQDRSISAKILWLTGYDIDWATVGILLGSQLTLWLPWFDCCVLFTLFRLWHGKRGCKHRSSRSTMNTLELNLGVTTNSDLWEGDLVFLSTDLLVGCLGLVPAAIGTGVIDSKIVRVCRKVAINVGL